METSELGSSYSYLEVLAFGPGNVNDLGGFRRADYFAKDYLYE